MIVVIVLVQIVLVILKIAIVKQVLGGGMKRQELPAWPRHADVLDALTLVLDLIPQQATLLESSILC